MFGVVVQARKIRLKLLSTLHDLVSNDESILNDGFYVRNFIINDGKLLKSLLDVLDEKSLNIPLEGLLRVITLRILESVCQVKSASVIEIKEVIQAHADRIESICTKSEALNEELVLARDILKMSQNTSRKNLEEISPKKAFEY